MNLQQYDLNLLVIFDSIYKEKHLTRAGEKLHMSQPAMSQALSRLRDTFNDQLFVRSGSEMIPTTLAMRMAENIQQILHLTEMTFSDFDEFIPSKSDRTFRLAMNDYTEMTIMPKLFKHLNSVAPHIKIECKHLSADDYQPALDYNYLDLILACHLEFGSNVYKQALFHDREVVVARADSPSVEQELTVERYLSGNHAQFKWPSCLNKIDEELHKMNLSRNVVLEVQHEMVLPLILKDNDLLVNMPKRMAEVFSELIPLTIMEIPVDSFDYQFHQYWHERNNNDPGHRWLRSQIKNISDRL